MFDLLAEDFFQSFDDTRFHRIFIVAARTVDTMTATGTATTPLAALFFSKFKPTKTTDHANIPVTSNALFNR